MGEPRGQHGETIVHPWHQTEEEWEFSLRECRRTFGQRYLDWGLDIESTSVLMGHASTKTTEGFYSRKKLSKTIESAKGTWLSTSGQKNCPPIDDLGES